MLRLADFYLFSIVFQKCISGGQKRMDRTSEVQANYEPLNLEVKYPDTAILLLRSPEKPILLAAAASLSKFGEKAKGNLRALFDLNVVENTLALIEHDDLFTRRFALKLLALMSAVQNVQSHLLKTDFYITLFIEMLSNESDIFLQEFSSRILAELSSHPLGAALILDKYHDVSYLFNKLEANDPDIKKNCIEIINNLLMDLNGLNVINCSKDFNFAAIYELFSQPYLIIQQLALNVVQYLVSYNSNDKIYEKFRASGGVQSLLEILSCEDWNDLHHKVLHIFNLVSRNLKTTEFILKTDTVRQLFNLVENTDNDQLKFAALNVLVQLTISINGKKLMHSQGLVNYMLEYSESYNQPEIQVIICHGIGNMTQYGPSAVEMLQENVVNYILSLLRNTEADWCQRQAAAYALKELFLSNNQHCINFLSINGQNYFIKLIEPVNNKFESDLPINNVPWEIQVTILQAIAAIADYSSLIQDLISFKLFDVLTSILEGESGSTDEVKIACCHTLSKFPINETVRKTLVEVNALKKLFEAILNEESVPVRNAASELVLLLCVDPLLAMLCLQEGFLIYMIKNRNASRYISTWDVCIEALFLADLPMKFAYTGRLSLHDVTGDGFYVLRRSSCPFPVIEDLFRLKLCPLEPIYVVNFSIVEKSENDFELDSKRFAFEASKDIMRRESFKKGLRLSEASINSWLDLKFGRLQTDYNLIAYLEAFKAELEAVEAEENDTFESNIPGLIQISKIASRAQRLGKFVARQMSGIDSIGCICIDQQLEIHLRSIRDSIENNIISLGHLKVGSSLERSLLFKVIADRIALPSSLVRGRYGKSWIEIAVPVIETPLQNMNMDSVTVEYNTKHRSKGRPLPPKYLHENFIVDLMDIPGDFIPMNSSRARSYHDTRSVCEFACCK